MSAAGTTVVRRHAGIGIAAWIVLPLLGAAAGLLLSRLPGWLTLLPAWVFALPFTPDRDQLLTLAAAIGAPGVLVLMIGGAVAGGILALLDSAETISLRIGPDALLVLSGDDEIARSAIGEVDCAFLETVEKKVLVIQTRDGGELFRGPVELAAGAVRDGLAAHGISWAEEDPHEARFQRWVDGMPGLSEHAQAVLRERRRVLEKKDQGDEERKQAEALRGEAARLGVVLRDRRGVQQWRPGGSPRPDTGAAA
ncbi:stable inheritance protein KleA [Brachybacterium hainanense]|uniref:Stable inheritance protein KleA n=1 Tax=Brachybacterium hainanense TaxID=1541174 RepID=A0ABV6RDS1_9MICO